MRSQRQLAEIVRDAVLTAEDDWPKTPKRSEQERLIGIIDQILRDLDQDEIVLTNFDDGIVIDGRRPR